MNTDAARERLTHAILDLRRCISRFQHQQGAAATVLVPSATTQDEGDDGGGAALLVTVPASQQEQGELENLRILLDSFEEQLRERGEWREQSSQASTTNVTNDANDNAGENHNTNNYDGDGNNDDDVLNQPLDLRDLQEAITLLSQSLASPSHPSSPPALNPLPPITSLKYLASLPWRWDADWGEFFTPSPTAPDHVLYISHWVYDPPSDSWMHVGRPLQTTPEHESMLLGPWEDWKWDKGVEEWFRETDMGRQGVREEGVVARWAVCEWRDEVEEGWVYLGRRRWW